MIGDITPRGLCFRNEIPLVSVAAKAFEELHPFNRWIQKRHGLDVHPPSEDVIRTARRAYAGMVSLVDELLSELSRFSLLDNTLVIFTSDHGEMLGEHGMWFKRTFMEDAIRVPFILSWPGVWDRGNHIQVQASLIDLFPTLLEIAGIEGSNEINRTVNGETLVGIIDSSSAEHQAVICEYCAEGILHPAIAIIGGRYKYVHVSEPPPLLFDLGADPFELTNLAGRNELDDIEKSFRGLINDKWLTGTLEMEIQFSQKKRH